MRFLAASLLATYVAAVSAIPDFPIALPGTSCPCNGEIRDKYIGFEFDAKGNPLKSGDTPFELPYGITVTGQRREKGNVAAPTENDLVIFNTEMPTGMDSDLGVDGEMKVLIINESNDKADPYDAR